jgi:hypothetical protein
LHAIEKLRELIRQTPYDSTMKHHLHARGERLMRYAALGDIIETHWHKPINGHADSWRAHRDINMVMLATSLAPGGYLSI